MSIGCDLEDQSLEVNLLTLQFELDFAQRLAVGACNAESSAVVSLNLGVQNK